LEFLVKRGILPDIDKACAEKVVSIIDSFKKVDYSSRLGALLEPIERKYYTERNFTILKEALKNL